MENLLGRKKIRLEDLINTDNKKNINRNEDSENESDTEKELKIELNSYKKIVSGKLDIKSIFSKEKELPDQNLKKEEHENKNKTQLNSDLKTTTLAHKLLNSLPTPKRKLNDKIQFCNSTITRTNNNQYRELSNPDILILSSQPDTEQPSNHRNQSYNNITDINANDQIEPNWELKYNIDVGVIESPNITKTEINKNQLKYIISNYKKEKQVSDQNQKLPSKYSKLSTKNKYGW